MVHTLRKFPRHRDGVEVCWFGWERSFGGDKMLVIVQAR